MLYYYNNIIHVYNKMPRYNIKLGKSTLNKIQDFLNSITNLNGLALDKLRERFEPYFLKEYKTLKEYSESVVCDKYIESAVNIVSKINNGKWSDDYFDVISANARYELAKYYTSNLDSDDIIDIYFNEVKREYILHPMNESDELEFIPENKDIFIKNNLKLVVNCAKRYRFLGVPFEDLIQAGNIGLLNAFDRFDTSKAKVRSEIIEIINNSEKSVFTKDEAQEILLSKITYGKTIKFIYENIPDGFSTKQEFIEWVKKNIKTAVFASVAFQWIKGAVLTSISQAKQVTIPYSKLADGYTNFLSIDQMNPREGDDNSSSLMESAAGDAFCIEMNNIEASEEQKKYKSTLDNIFCCLNEEERRIVKKRFGIGVPDALSLQEIGQQEGYSSVRIKKIINESLQKLYNSIDKKQRKELECILFD